MSETTFSYQQLELPLVGGDGEESEGCGPNCPCAR